MPEKIENKNNMITVTLEGEFKKTGLFEFEEKSNIIIKKELFLCHLKKYQ